LALITARGFLFMLNLELDKLLWLMTQELWDLRTIPVNKIVKLLAGEGFSSLFPYPSFITFGRE
ncbi:MAG: hypothetical protein ACYTXE_45770, partial [Nostoc sp.]